MLASRLDRVTVPVAFALLFLVAATPAAAQRPLSLSLADGALLVEDLDPGATVVVTTVARSAREVALPAHTLQEGPGNRLEKLEDDRRYIELLWVRPGLGAWRLTALDGSLEDESPASDGRVLTSPGTMEAVGDSEPPPDTFERDDLLFRVAPREAEYYAARIVR